MGEALRGGLVNFSGSRFVGRVESSRLDTNQPAVKDQPFVGWQSSVGPRKASTTTYKNTQKVRLRQRIARPMMGSLIHRYGSEARNHFT